MGNLKQGENKNDFSRRKFIKGSASAVAATSLLGVGSIAAAQDGTANKPEDPDTSVRWKSKPGDLYNRTYGYGDKDVTGWKGRIVYGATIGILQIECNIPMLPGDMGNPTTFDYPVIYESLGNLDPNWVLSPTPHPEVLKATISACKRLELQGVRAIIGNCGFFANYQTDVASEINTPFFNGSLMQVPMLLNSIGQDKKVGIMTANGPMLEEAPALKNCGVQDKDMNRIVIYGNQDGEQMLNCTLESGYLNPLALQKELIDLGKKMVEDHPDVGAVVLECTEFPPHAYAIQDALRLSVWDFTTMANFMHAGAMRAPFTGWM